MSATPDTGAERSPFARLRVRGLLGWTILTTTAVFLIGVWIAPSLRRNQSVVTNMMLAYAAIFMVLVVRGRIAKLEWRRLLGPAPRAEQLPLLGIVVPLGLITAATLILLFVPLSYLAPDVVQHTILDSSPLEKITSTQQFVLLFINIAVIAPIVEELLFRGFVLHRFAHKWGTSAGVVASSALFAIGHVEWIGHFVTGVAFALIYLRTRSLWMSMLTHGVYNAMFAVSIGWNFFTHQPEDIETLADFRSSLAAGFIAFIAGVFLLWMYLDLYWKEKKASQIMVGKVPYYAEAGSGEMPSA